MTIFLNLLSLMKKLNPFFKRKILDMLVNPTAVQESINSHVVNKYPLPSYLNIKYFDFTRISQLEFTLVFC